MLLVLLAFLPGANAHAQTPEQLVDEVHYTAGGAKNFADFTVEIAKSIAARVSDEELVQAGPDDQFAVSNDAVKIGMDIGARGETCRAPVDTYRVQFTDPGEIIQANGPQGRPGEADLRKPWVWFREERNADPSGCETYFPTRIVCSEFVNPTNYTRSVGDLTYTRVTPSIGSYYTFDSQESTNGRRPTQISFDVRGCDDGKGYDFYRVTFNGEQIPTDSGVGGYEGWGPRDGDPKHGIPDYWQGFASSLLRGGRLIGGQQNPLRSDGRWSENLDGGIISWKQVQLCGYRGSETECLRSTRSYPEPIGDWGSGWGNYGLGAFYATAHPPKR